MSIETNHNLTNTEVNARISDIEYGERGERIATIVDNITIKQVPVSLEAAEKLVDTLSKYNGATQAEVAAHPEIKEKIGPDFIDDLDEVANLGINNWRLTKEERADWQAVRGTRASKSILLPPRMLSLMETLSSEDGTDTTAEKVSRLRAQASKRLELHNAIVEKYGEYVEPEAQNASTGRRVVRDTGKSPYATGDGMITITEKATPTESGGTVTSGTGSEGKSRRATRPATSLAAAELKDTDNIDEAKTGRGNTHRRDGISDLITLDKSGRARYESGVSKGKNNATRNIKGRFMTTHELDVIESQQDVIRDGLDQREAGTASSVAKNKKAKNLEMPESYGNPDDWNTRSNKEKRTIIKTAKIIEAQEAEQVTTVDTRKRRLAKDLGHRAAAAATTGMSVVGSRIAKGLEYYQDVEKGKRRKITLAVIAGATALAGLGIAYVATKNGTSVSGNRLQELMQNKPHDVAAKKAALDELQQKPLGDMNTGAAIEKAHTIKLHSGDTIWGESKENLMLHGNRHPNNAQVTEEMHRVMKLNHINEAQARGLDVGTKIKL
ncbi:MAG: hypothetical protein ABIR37_03700 [Candidatus Saccharimonadales bacterium]